MRIVKIAAAHINNIVGDFEGNIQKHKEAVLQVADSNPHFIVFQEMSVAGYPCEDLVSWPLFIERQWEAIDEFTTFLNETCADTYVIFGANYLYQDQVYNCAVVALGKHIYLVSPKQHLPEYKIFYDGRTTSAGTQKLMRERFYNQPNFGDAIIDNGKFRFALEVCEDIWTQNGPMHLHAINGAEIIFNISASPWRQGVEGMREALLKVRSSDNCCTVVYVNAVGGNDSLVFDGGGYIAQNGSIIHSMRSRKECVELFEVNLDTVRNARMVNTTFRTDTLANDIQSNIVYASPGHELLSNWTELPSPDWTITVPPSRDPIEQKISTIIDGLDGYFSKSRAFDRICISLSGGRDSILTAILAYLWAKETGRSESIIDCYSMPTRITTDTTRGISQKLCDGLGCNFVERSIQEIFEYELSEIAASTGMSVEALPRLAKQNAQTRIRAGRMWNISNTTNALWLQTGNMSEKISGYTTVGGDLQGGYSLLGNMKKTEINAILGRLAYCINPNLFYFLSESAKNAIVMLLVTKASAELEEGQEDERDLMPYEVLDTIIHLYLGERMTPKDIWLSLLSSPIIGTTSELQVENWVKDFLRRFHRNIFKWVQGPESVHVQDVDADRERALQLPVIHSISWLKLDEPWATRE